MQAYLILANGRVFRGVPAPSNMTVPPHRFVGDSRLVIGEDAGQRRT